MNLKKYIEEQKLTHSEFGKRIGKSQGYVTLLIHGKRRPSPSLALLIEQVTNKKVCKEELLWPKNN